MNANGYLVNVKLVADHVSSLVAMDFVDVTTTSLIKVTGDTVLWYFQGLDGGGGVLNDKITITVQGSTAEKLVNVVAVAKELAFLCNRAKSNTVGNLTRMQVIDQNFANTKADSIAVGTPGIITITTVTA
jgi:hypothetical protein|tara:strand:- start:45 stop:434 length:390 start_codon:yes stop_codon:yes gene_type:complete